MRGIHRWPVDSPHKGPVFPCHDVILITDVAYLSAIDPATTAPSREPAMVIVEIRSTIQVRPHTRENCKDNRDMMTSSNGNIFSVTGHLCGEFTGHRWIPAQRPALMFSLIRTWMNGRINNREAGDLRRHRAHYDVTIMHWADTCLGRP